MESPRSGRALQGVASGLLSAWIARREAPQDAVFAVPEPHPEARGRFSACSQMALPGPSRPAIEGSQLPASHED
jgi:hypothetical protein